MKKILVYISFFMSLVAFSQSPKVEAVIDTAQIRIGEQFLYKLSVHETENVILPKLEDLKGLEIVDSLKIDTINKKLIRKFILTGFDSGAFYIPRQQVFIKNQAFLTDSLLVNVTTVAVDTTKVKSFAIKGIKGEPYQFDDYKNTLFWLIGLLLMVATVLYFALKRTKEEDTQTSKTLLAPYEEALKNLSLLDKKLLWQNNKTKQYYTELTGVLRHYIERELHIPAMETTTNGLIETLADFSTSESILTDKETIKGLEGLLKQADLVKFAKSKPLAHEIEGDRNIAENILHNLKPNIADKNIAVENLQEVIIVEKPTVKKPSLVARLFVILILILIAFGFAYGISQAKKMSNSLKSPINNVQ